MAYKPQQFVAHRGLQQHYPENSLLGIQAAIDAGAVNVEVDVQFSQDGIAMLYHDHDMRRLSAIDANINDYRAADLTTILAHEPQRLGGQFSDCTIQPLMSLIALMQSHPEVHFYIELKAGAVMDHGLEYCLAHLAYLFAGVMPHLTLISFDPLVVKHAKQDFGFISVGLVLQQWQDHNAQIQATGSDIAYINIKKIPTDAPIIADCPIAVYEIAEPDLARAALERGASLIESFAIDDLIAALCRHDG